ncbi:hypothetical protein [Rhodopirellula sp. MGV]|uniref:hypothetical protein n=1 Tax=Rhodopirellula sp. MGV TaxID=2023130 RepID=UPI000B95FB1C|nr:hypothetical protein [Rhodopirellula sp. MGV]OYP36859.1 hypothetical protein CGZ80_07370 [Rhodopirellula sp. MGV]PNY34055.1 hypothetical protein C2E31_25340 [Rhodopirellula baltica]
MGRTAVYLIFRHPIEFLGDLFDDLSIEIPTTERLRTSCNADSFYLEVLPAAGFIYCTTTTPNSVVRMRSLAAELSKTTSVVLVSVLESAEVGLECYDDGYRAACVEFDADVRSENHSGELHWSRFAKQPVDEDQLLELIYKVGVYAESTVPKLLELLGVHLDPIKLFQCEIPMVFRIGTSLRTVRDRFGGRPKTSSIAESHA